MGFKLFSTVLRKAPRADLFWTQLQRHLLRAHGPRLAARITFKIDGLRARETAREVEGEADRLQIGIPQARLQGGAHLLQGAEHHIPFQRQQPTLGRQTIFLAVEELIGRGDLGGIPTSFQQLPQAAEFCPVRRAYQRNQPVAEAQFALQLATRLAICEDGAPCGAEQGERQGAPGMVNDRRFQQAGGKQGQPALLVKNGGPGLLRFHFDLRLAVKVVIGAQSDGALDHVER